MSPVATNTQETKAASSCSSQKALLKRASKRLEERQWINIENGRNIYAALAKHKWILLGFCQNSKALRGEILNPPNNPSRSWVYVYYKAELQRNQNFLVVYIPFYAMA